MAKKFHAWDFPNSVAKKNKMQLQRWQKVGLVVAGTLVACKVAKTTIKVGFTFAASFGLGFWLFLYLTDDLEAVEADMKRTVSDKIHDTINRRVGLERWNSRAR